MQHCSLPSCMRPLAPASAIFDFQNNQDGLNDPKEIKYNLHYDDVLGDIFTAATPATTE